MTERYLLKDDWVFAAAVDGEGQGRKRGTQTMELAGIHYRDVSRLGGSKPNKENTRNTNGEIWVKY